MATSTAPTLWHGRVSAVYLDFAGAALVTALVGGEATVAVENVYDFNPLGGTFQILADDTNAAETTGVYTGIDTSANTLTGVTGITHAHATDAFVSPDTAGTAYTTRVIVAREGYDDGDIDARLPHRLQDATQFAEGIYDQNSGAAVTVIHDGTEFVISDLLNEQLATDGSHIDGSTITGVGGSTDGAFPASSPAPTLYGGIGLIGVKWSPISNADPVGYEVHISTSTGFTADGTTLSAKVVATTDVITKMPDGTALAYFQGDGVTPQTYYVRIIAFDDDGYAVDGTRAGGQSTQQSVTLVQATGGATGDIAASTILGLNIFGGTITGDKIAGHTIEADRLSATLTFSNVFQTSAAGTQRVVIDGTAVTGGIFLYDSTGAALVSLPLDAGATASFKGNVQTGAITITGNLTIQGTTNIMDKGSQLTLNEKQGSANTSPTLLLGYDALALTGITTGYTGVIAPQYDSAGGAGGATAVYYALGNASGSCQLQEFDATTGALLRSVLIGAGDDTGIGVVRAGTKIWVLGINGSSVCTWYRITQATFSVDTTVAATNMPNSGNTIIQIQWGASGGGSASGKGPYGVGYDGTYVLVLGWASSANGAVKTIKRFDMTSGTPVLHDTQSLINGQTFTNPLGIAKYCMGIAYDGTNYWTLIGRFSAAGVPLGFMIEKYVISTLTLGVSTGDTMVDNDATDDQTSSGSGAGAYSGAPRGLTYNTTSGKLVMGKGTGASLRKFSTWIPTAATMYFAYAWQIADTVIDTCTVSTATPSVVTVASVHGLAANDEIFFTNSGGALPAGITANTPYYVLSTSLTTTTFKFAATKGGTGIHATTTGTGTHTVHRVEESLASPISTMQLKDSSSNTRYRGQVTVTVPSFPSGIDHDPLYTLASLGGLPASSALLKNRLSNGNVSTDTGSVIVVSGEDAAGQSPRTTTNLPGSTSTITATAASWTTPWQIRGDGTFTFPATTHNGLPSTPEVQVLTPSGSPTGGTFDLTFSSSGPNGGKTSVAAAIARNASAATIASALNAIDSIIQVGGVTCTGGPINSTAVTVTFSKGGAQNLIVLSANAMTGGSSPTIAISRSTSGLPVVGQVAYDTVAATLATWDGASWRYDALDDWAHDQNGLREAAFVMSGTERLLKCQNFPVGQGSGGVGMSNQRANFMMVYWPGGEIHGYLQLQVQQGAYTDNGGAFYLYGADTSGNPVVSSTTTLSKISALASTGGALGNDAATSRWKQVVSLAPISFAGGGGYLAAGIYYLAFLYSESAQTTAPQLAASANSYGSSGDQWNSATYNMPTGFPYMAAVAARTSLPATQLISSLDATVDNCFWAALY